MKRVQSIYLVQRAEIRRPLGDFRGLRLSQAVDFDYMGSAEFEFGALPNSFRQIEANMDSANLRVVPEIMEGEIALRVFSCLNDEQWAEYLPELIKLREGKTRTKEMTRFAKDYKTTYGKCDFWWDIVNDVMFSFDKQFMNSITDYVGASLNYMNEQKKKNA